MSNVVELSSSDFNGQTLKKYKKKYVLIMFYTTWCGFCVRAKPEYEKLASEFAKLDKKIKIARLDCDKYEDFIQNEYNLFSKGPKIQGYPTILLYKDGIFFKKYEGDRSLDSYKILLSNYI